MTTVSAFDSARRPYTLELAARFNSPYDPYAWPTGSRSRSSLSSNPATIPPSTTTAVRCFASNSLMATRF